MEIHTSNKVTYFSALEILSLLRPRPSSHFFFLKWHRDAFMRWSQFCVIPAHMQTTSNRTSEGFKGTVRIAYTRLQTALLCVCMRGGRDKGGEGVERPGDLMKNPQCNSLRGATTRITMRIVKTPLSLFLALKSGCAGNCADSRCFDRAPFFPRSFKGMK